MPLTLFEPAFVIVPPASGRSTGPIALDHWPKKSPWIEVMAWSPGPSKARSRSNGYHPLLALSAPITRASASPAATPIAVRIRINGSVSL